jgi:hypothetical protein
MGFNDAGFRCTRAEYLHVDLRQLTGSPLQNMNFELSGLFENYCYICNYKPRFAVTTRVGTVNRMSIGNV